MYFHTYGFFVERKANLADRSRQLVFGRVYNKKLKEWDLFEFIITIFFISDEIYVRLDFPDLVNPIVDCVYLFVSPYFFELSFGVVLQIEVLKLQSLPWLKGFEPKLGMVVTDIRLIFLFELMLPFNNRFCIFFLQILNTIVNQLAIIIVAPHPADQFGLLKVFNVSSFYLGINFGTPFLVVLQINQPQFLIVSAP